MQEGLTERWRILIVFVVATAVAIISGYGWLSYAAALLFYTIWHARQLIKLNQWLAEQGKEKNAPILVGRWGSVINHVLRLQKKHQRIRRRLENSIRRFQQTLETLPDATILVGSSGEIRWSNAAAQTYLGIRNPSDIGVRLVNLIRSPEFIAFFNRGQLGESINIVSPLSSALYLNICVVPYGNGEKLMTARDISELMRVDVMRRDFVSNASHELKTPLTVMKGYMELLQSDPRLTADLTPLVDTALAQAERLGHLVENLLALSRLEGTTVNCNERVELSPALKTIVTQARQLGPQHDLQCELHNDFVIFGCRQDLLSAFSNLIFNAIYHTPPGTRVEICCQPQGADSVLLHVRDNGPGIEQHHLDRLTERFYRVEEGRGRTSGQAIRGQGTGLGLAIAKHIIYAHGGQLEIKSRVGEGTQFSVVLPLCRA